MIVNAFGYPRHNLGETTKYTMLFESHEPSEVLFIQDPAIVKYMHGSLQVDPRHKIILRMNEDRNMWDQMAIHNAILNNTDKRVDLLLTWEPTLLHLPYAVFCPVTDSSQWEGCTEADFKIYPKSKLVSAISSNKAIVPGHQVRLNFINAIRDKVDLYGRGFHDIQNKLEGLKDYMFSVAIENVVTENGFSEKIQDCFLTGTIPIYYGAPNIGEFYDLNGILVFHNQEELDSILLNLTPELYYSKLQAVYNNYRRALSYPTFNDSFYDLYFKHLL